MIEFHIPGYPEKWQIKHLVLDLNGTLALDGRLLPGVKEKIRILAKQVDVYILTADTFGTAQEQFRDLPCRLHLLTPENQIRQKEAFIRELGPEQCAAFGNGMNDTGMLKAARVGICITGPEGAATQALLASDIVVHDINRAFDLLLVPGRMKATLRK